MSTINDKHDIDHIRNTAKALRGTGIITNDARERIAVLLDEYAAIAETLLIEDDVQGAIAGECDAVKALLLAKNREYGNSALEPIGVFAAGVAAVDQIAVRIDDKLKRIQTTRQLDDVAIHEDTEQDLIGYLILLRVARSQRGNP